MINENDCQEKTVFSARQSDVLHYCKDLIQLLSFDLKVFGFIMLGVHIINIKELSTSTIDTNESNSFCPVWNHRIILKETSEGKTEYTDEVEIGAGWKRPLIYLWAKAFYSHRQKRWIKLLNKQ